MNAPARLHKDAWCAELQRQSRLGPRAAEVVYWVCAGLTNRQISQRLTLAVKTVEAHLTTALNRFGVNNRTALAVTVVRRVEQIRKGKS